MRSKFYSSFNFDRNSSNSASTAESLTVGGWAVLPSNICAFSRTNAANHSFRSELARAMALPTQALGTCFRRYSCPKRKNIGKIAKFCQYSPRRINRPIRRSRIGFRIREGKSSGYYSESPLNCPSQKRLL